MNKSKLLSARTVDRRRPIILLLYVFSTAVGIIGGLLTYQHKELVTSLALFYCAIASTSLSISQMFLKAGIRNGRQYWRRGDKCVVLTTTYTLVGWEFGSLLLAGFSLPLGTILLPLRARGEWLGPVILVIAGTVSIPFLLPILKAGCPSRQRITLTRNGVELTRIDGHTDRIRWQDHPTLIGGREGDALIVLKNYDELHYPMAYLPMSMRQLERLLSTFSTNSRLRAKLSSPEALDTVLTILEPTEEELTDDSWTWRPTAPAESQT